MEYGEFVLYFITLEPVLISFYTRICVIMTTVVSRKLKN